MRCVNCGWNNPDGLSKCQKCNQELREFNFENHVGNESGHSMSHTVMDCGRHRDSGYDSCPQKGTVCPRCGYPVSAESPFCPNCGFGPDEYVAASQKGKATVRDVRDVLYDDHVKEDVMRRPENLKRTVRSHDVAVKATVREISPEMFSDASDAVRSDDRSFRLMPLDNFDGRTPSVLEFKGDKATVGRHEISGKEASVPEDAKAMFEFDGNRWRVKDENGSKAVFVCASHPIEIAPGDIVVIGNRRFIFE